MKLTQYQSLKAEVEELEARIQSVRADAYNLKSPQLTGMPKAPGYANDSMPQLLVRIEELTELYLKKKAQLVELCLEIEKEIESLESIERRVIRFRYIDGKSWSEISKLTGYSVAHLHRIHKNFLRKNER